MRCLGIQEHAVNYAHGSHFIVFWRAGGRFKNTYELLNLRALKFSPVNKIFFQGMGTFEIPHKISYSYIERYDFYTKFKF